MSPDFVRVIVTLALETSGELYGVVGSAASFNRVNLLSDSTSTKGTSREDCVDRASLLARMLGNR